MEQPLAIPTFTNTAPALAPQPLEAAPRPTDFLQVIESPEPQPRGSLSVGIYAVTLIAVALVGWFGQLTFRGMAIANAVEADKITLQTRDIRRDTLQIQADIAQRLAPVQLEASAKEMGMDYGPVPNFVTVNADQYVPAAPPGATVLTSSTSQAGQAVQTQPTQANQSSGE